MGAKLAMAVSGAHKGKPALTLRTLVAMTMVQASFLLISGWFHAAMAGGGRWTGRGRRAQISENSSVDR